MPIPEDYEDDIEECLVGDILSVDDLLLGPASGPVENPAIEKTWALDWPINIRQRRDKKTGEIVTYYQHPTGLVTRAKVSGVDPRVKIYTDIGMLAIDRDIKTSCLWRTRFCAKHCYNRALFTVRPNLKKAGPPDEAFWTQLDGGWLHLFLHSGSFIEFADRVDKTPAFLRGRIRLATRGEAFAEPEDVLKVADVCTENPRTLFWITTRSWIDNQMADLIEEHVLDLPNARVLASLDPSHSEKQYDRIRRMGWNTIFFGDDTFTEGRFLCPKTWEKKSSYCRICKNGCFKDGPVHVHLRVHGTKVTERELREFRGRS